MTISTQPFGSSLMKLLAIIILLTVGCSKSRPKDDIIAENSTKNLINHLGMLIELSALDARRTNGNWSLPIAMESITISNGYFTHTEREPFYFFRVNPKEDFWLSGTNRSEEIVIYSPQPFIWKGKTNYVVAPHYGKPYMTNTLPTWKPVPLPPSMKGFHLRD